MNAIRNAFCKCRNINFPDHFGISRVSRSADFLVGTAKFKSVQSWILLDIENCCKCKNIKFRCNLTTIMNVFVYNKKSCLPLWIQPEVIDVKYCSTFGEAVESYVGFALWKLCSESLLTVRSHVPVKVSEYLRRNCN